MLLFFLIVCFVDVHLLDFDLLIVPFKVLCLCQLWNNFVAKNETKFVENLSSLFRICDILLKGIYFLYIYSLNWNLWPIHSIPSFWLVIHLLACFEFDSWFWSITWQAWTFSLSLSLLLSFNQNDEKQSILISMFEKKMESRMKKKNQF